MDKDPNQIKDWCDCQGYQGKPYVMHIEVIEEENCDDCEDCQKREEVMLVEHYY